VLHRLTRETTMHALPQVIEESFVHQTLETTMNLARLARGVVAVTGRDNPYSAELKAADGTLTLYGVAGQA
jgi:hypothetical protein